MGNWVLVWCSLDCSLFGVNFVEILVGELIFEYDEMGCD